MAAARRVIVAFAFLATCFALATPAVASAATVVYRVNAGGPQLAGTPAWQADTAASPSPYVNAPPSYLFSTTDPVSTTHPSIPAGTPAQLFQTERWDPAEPPEMQWDFPVTPGWYEVRLYFADIYWGTQSIGARVFDVLIEGQVVIDDYDIYFDVGGFAGVMKSFLVSSDSNLDIDFGHVVENPALKGIEVLTATGASAQLGASPTSLDFGTVAVGATLARSVALVNLGAAGDPPIVVGSTTIGGPDAASFSDSFADGSNVTLAPGQSTTISVSFTPSSGGTKSAALAVNHSGSNDPLSIPLSGTATTGAPPGGAWQTLAASGPNRQEVSYVYVSGKFYLAGGSTAHEAYDPVANTWTSVAPLPTFLDHIQGVEVGGKIYYVGGLISWPSFQTNTVYIYNPATNSFSQGANMPRPRGAGGVAVFGGKIYYAGGLNNGVAVKWFDVYDPVANTWTQLPDMPTARDHFHAAVVDGKFYAIGGRNKDISATTTVNEAYDFTAGTWQTGLAPLPTARGGFAAAVLGNEILIMGGEGGGPHSGVFAQVEAYDTAQNTWRILAPMPVPRHGIQAAVCNGAVYVAAGAKAQGAALPSNHHDVFSLAGTGCGAPPVPVGFGKSTLAGETSTNPTSLQFGPDGRLYVAQQNGLIKVYTVARNDTNSYSVTATETITAIQSIPNHNDNGALASSVTTRQVTGLLVTGSATNPVVYVTSSDPRIGGGPGGTNTNLDTNSSMISRLTWTGSSWQKLDLVRGLPRSEENHSANGLQLDPATNTLYVAMGGNTNQGAPSNNFTFLPEFALSAAILKVDLNAIGNTTYDLPTLDDEDRAGNPDQNDPFGGNNGKNQAKLVPGGPVQVHAPGFRNPYDLVITSTGRMYTIDNGGNAGWGAIPKQEGPAGVCTNEVNEPGISERDTLHYVTAPGYYGGHPNPTRGNAANTFNANGQSPVTTANPIECDYRTIAERNALATWGVSTNGIVEYRASNFGGAMKGDLLTAHFGNGVDRMKLNAPGTGLLMHQTLFSTVGQFPLDVTAQGDAGPFPGTVWVADWGDGNLYVFEPNDFSGGGGGCTGAYDWSLDEDGDGYKNADEIDNGTDPCSAADRPPDWDGDGLSNLNDPDDDNDGIPDTSDRFAIDPDNGLSTTIPVQYTWDNDAPAAGGLLGLGFTGLMTNGSSNYESLFDPEAMTAGGAAGVMTVDGVPDGDAFGTANSQQYGFQFGFAVPSEPFVVRTRILAPFAGLTPQDYQSMGLFIGTGDQDNYVKLVVAANAGAGGIEVLKEVAAVPTLFPKASVPMPGPEAVDLYLTVDPTAATVQASYSVRSSGSTGPRIDVGGPVAIPASWLSGSAALAAGVISTSTGPAPPFAATWDFIEVLPADDTTPPVVVGVVPAEGATAVAASTLVSATFSEAVDPATVSGSTFSLVKEGEAGTVAATVSYDAGAKRATLDPAADLDAGATYTATVKGGGSGVKDLAGNPLAADKAWSFTVSAAGSSPLAHDSFTRTVANGWGSADAGGAWSLLAGSAANFSVTGGKGATASPSGLQQLAALAAVSVTDLDAMVEIATGLPSGNSIFTYVTVRQQSNGAYYRVGPYVTPTGTVLIRTQTHTGTTLLADVDTGLTYTPGETLLLRLQAQGTSPTTLRAKVWKLGSAEPGAWTLTHADATGGLQQAGAIGLRTINLGTGTVTVTFDNLALTQLGSGSEPPDTTPPVVVAVVPAEGTSGVAASTPVSATFSEAVDAATVSGATFSLLKQGGSSPVAATVTYDPMAKKATLAPAAHLDSGATYTATVKGGAGGVKDLAGNPLAADKTWSFTTAPAPSGITLNARGYKVKGLHHVDLTWSGATGATVDIWRGVTKIAAATENDGFHTDATGAKGGGSYTYKVCEGGSTTACSATVTVTF